MRAFDDGRLSRYLARARDGDDDALEALLCRLHPILLRFARAQLAEEAEAEETASDIAQKAMIRITRGLDGCRAEADPQIHAWALQVVKNLCTDHFRAARARALRSLPLSSWTNEVEGSLLDTELAGRTRTDRGGRVLNRALQEALRALPITARRLLRLRVQQGMTWSQIARELGLTRDAAKRRFERIQSRLRKETLRKIENLSEPDREAALRYLKRACP